MQSTCMCQTDQNRCSLTKGGLVYEIDDELQSRLSQVTNDYRMPPIVSRE